MAPQACNCLVPRELAIDDRALRAALAIVWLQPKSVAFTLCGMSNPISERLFERAQKHLPGGVNSPVRAFAAVEGNPIFIERAKGAYLYGSDSERYVDYVGSWGPMILGHAHSAVVDAIGEAAARGSSFGAPTAKEIDLAELIEQFFPSIEMSRLVSSGTEAVMGALRAARGFTGRDLVVKFEGCYHGGADYLLVKAGSGAATFGVPTSAGVPEAIASTTRVLPYNDLDAVSALFEAEGDRIAALILEPVVGNMGCVPPASGYLAGLRALTKKHGVVLVFDEVMTGFRVSAGGAQGLYEIVPDLTCLGKIVGGGLPVGAYGGRREIMEKVSPLGPVYQAGTLSGNPLAVAAGLTTLGLLKADGFYEALEAKAARLQKSIERSAKAAGVPLRVQRVGSMMTPFFTEGPVTCWPEAAACDTAAFGRMHRALLNEGVYWPPAQYEAGFISAAHDEEALSATEAAFDAALRSI